MVYYALAAIRLVACALYSYSVLKAEKFFSLVYLGYDLLCMSVAQAYIKKHCNATSVTAKQRLLMIEVINMYSSIDTTNKEPSSSYI